MKKRENDISLRNNKLSFEFYITNILVND